MLSLIKFIALTYLLVAVDSQANLPADEVEALRVIGETIGKTDWDFSVDPCSGLLGWITPNKTDGFEVQITCDCSFANYTICHVVSIKIKSQSLQGRVPSEIVSLPFLQEIDLTRNLLSGSIPPEWGSLNLRNICLNGNQITGPIPRELGNINTLVKLNLEYNQLSGSIPPEFGNLPLVERITLTSNYLTGEIPASLGNLTTLWDFRVSDNKLTGSIPNFIESWPNISILMIEGSGLSGPIPSGIASLTNLTDLRISDLNGNHASTLPSLTSSRNLTILILRSCNIRGQIPDFIGQMTQLSLLDLSFNSLSGFIPDNFEALNRVEYIYLTGNSLGGRLPTWMQTEGRNIDLSYNNLSSENLPLTCQQSTLNLFASSKGNTTGIVSCLRRLRCPQTYYSLHINCGGSEVQNGSYIYEADTTAAGPSNVYHSNDANWAFSSTGNFVDNRSITYILRNTSSLIGPNPQLYMDARISPLSLTYYSYCLQNGNYTVNLYFAEIRFTNDNTYFSLGRRIFDIYIQGNLAQKDFNIEDEAGGVNIGIVKNFTAVVVDSTLDIRFYWAGKGTNAIPFRGIYGPLISAISVNPNFPIPRPPSENKNIISTGAIVGIVLGIISGAVLCLGILWWMGCLRHKDTLEYELQGVDIQTTTFTLRQIKAATKNFDPSNKIGEGGFGPVYKGLLSDGTAIAVKQLSSKSKQGNREFVTEIGMISALQHPHLVKLYGCCIEGKQLLLIYEYMENNSLARALFGAEEHQIQLDWVTRHKICIGIAKCLAYLHEESRIKVVHRDIKATNVLLDQNLDPKISDFGLAKLDEEDGTHISTRVFGTYGYMAPEYAMRGYLTDKADVYSFGIVLLEVVSGISITTTRLDHSYYLLDWANSLKENGNFLELVDPKLESNFNEGEVFTAIQVALSCINIVAADRPSMSKVVSILEGKSGVQGFLSNSNVSIEKTNHKKWGTSDEAISSNTGEFRNTISTDVACTGSTVSPADLYPIDLDSSYWEKRDR